MFGRDRSLLNTTQLCEIGKPINLLQVSSKSNPGEHPEIK
jgi:hypothetical protein